jgi:UDP-N-acetylmuramate--alanine ligase
LKLEDKHIVYFLGIGGIGMSALARWFMHLGKRVYGYDKVSTPLTKKLESEGAGIHYDDSVSSIPDIVLLSKTDTLVVLTPAVPGNHKELNYLKDNGFDILKRSEVLGIITKDMYSVAVAGTHGKTTTSSMIAHILKVACKSSLSIMGGILQGYDSNLIIEGEPSTDTVAVLEADEYDRSFLRLSPDIAVVTSADADHLDIYGKHDELKSSFRQFVHQVKPNGHLFVHDSLTGWLKSENPDVTTHAYAMGGTLNGASNIHIAGSVFKFDYHGHICSIPGISLSVPGFHNVENAVAAISVALQLGIGADIIRNALGSFKGVKRRFEYQIQRDDLVYIDDYAHHPTEIAALLQSVRELYPGKKITAVFQPHLYTRTRDFVDGFAESLDLADEVFLMNIYPARELPVEGITSQIIFRKMKNANKKLVPDNELLDVVMKSNPEVLLTIGAGDIDRFVLPIKDKLEGKK